jgi:hypothetical protein
VHDIFASMPQFFSQALQNSALIRFFLKSERERKWWTSSFMHKVVTLPLAIIRYLSNKWAKPLGDGIRGSIVLNSLAEFLSNVFAFSTKVYGLMLLAFSLTEGILWILLRVNDLKSIMLRVLLLVVSLILILIDKPLKALYSGSSLAQLIGSFFRNQVG